MSRAKSPTHVVPFRRRAEGKTNFQKRLGMVKSGKTRLVVRRSNRYVDVQFVNFEPAGDKTLLTVTGKKLSKEFNYPAKRNVWSAYLAGLLAGKLAKKAGVGEFILDTGMYTVSKGNIVFAALKGAVDAGLTTSYDESMLPSDKLDNPKDKAAFDEAKKKIMG
jgi:large subunit ribosomal protein L18